MLSFLYSNLEKLVSSKEAIRFCEQISTGELSADAAVAALLKKRGLKQACTNVMEFSVFDTAQLELVLRQCLVKI